MTSDADAYIPRQVHPVFYGSFDWHSCVHGYWLLARIRRLHPGLPEASAIDVLFDDALTRDKLEMEHRYLKRATAQGFERPYGWAWLLMLSAELREGAFSHAATLQPLAETVAQRLRAYLALMTYPVRTGTHTNTAFAMILAHRYAVLVGDDTLRQLIAERARGWFKDDRDARGHEPSGEDFLSPTLTEALIMQCVLPAEEFLPWLDRFLPGLALGLPSALFAPPIVSDRTDGKIAHLDGLALTRAWAFRALTETLPAGSDCRSRLTEAAAEHLAAGLDHVRGDYMGEHWLSTFALLALEGVAGKG